MTFLISIDPGQCTGWARWDHGRLSSCGIRTSEVLSVYGHLVIEKPQVYRATRSKGDPNDLIELAILVGRYVERCTGEVTLVSPAEWKGQVTKHIHAHRIIDALSLDELHVMQNAEQITPKGDRHNMIDAIGLGLWKLGRLTRGGAT